MQCLSLHSTPFPPSPAPETEHSITLPTPPALSPKFSHFLFKLASPVGVVFLHLGASYMECSLWENASSCILVIYAFLYEHYSLVNSFLLF